MTLSAWPSPAAAAERAGEVDVDAGDVGAGQVVDGDGVGAAEGVDVDRLDAGGVHRDAADVAENVEPVAVGGQADLLGDVRAVEQHRVGAVLALDGVAAVAGIPDEGVVAGAQQGQVVAAVAVDRVVAVAAEQRVVARGCRRACRCRRRRPASSAIASAASAEASIDVVAAEGVDGERSFGPPDARSRPGPQAGRPRRSDASPLTSIASSPLVPLTMTRSAGPSPRCRRACRPGRG